MIALASAVVVIGGRARLRRFEGRVLIVTGTATPDGQSKELFSAVHGLLRTGLARWREGQPPIGFEIIGRASEVQFRAWVASRDERHLRAALRGAYPGVEFGEAEPERLAGVRLVARAGTGRGVLRPGKGEGGRAEGLPAGEEGSPPSCPGTRPAFGLTRATAPV